MVHSIGTQSMYIFVVGNVEAVYFSNHDGCHHIFKHSTCGMLLLNPVLVHKIPLACKHGTFKFPLIFFGLQVVADNLFLVSY